MHHQTAELEAATLRSLHAPIATAEAAQAAAGERVIMLCMPQFA
jgi:hypothetical protein